MNLKTIAAAALALGLFLPVAARAQEPQPQEPPDRGVSDTRPFPPGMRRPRPVRNTARKQAQQGCWAKAGISKAAMEQRRALQERTRSEVEAVCTNSSLSDQQKREQIHQIQQATQQQLAGMLTPQQQSALQACQRANAHPHAGGGPHPAAPSPGPCGFLH